MNLKTQKKKNVKWVVSCGGSKNCGGISYTIFLFLFLLVFFFIRKHVKNKNLNNMKQEESLLCLCQTYDFNIELI